MTAHARPFRMAPRPSRGSSGRHSGYIRGALPPDVRPAPVQYGCAEVWMTILESGWNLWVWLVGVVSRRWVWLVGGIYGYGYNV